jgi:hypothetical protein
MAVYIMTYVHFFIISRSFLLRMRNISDQNCAVNQNTHYVFRNFFFEILAVYAIMWKNIACNLLACSPPCGV